MSKGLVLDIGGTKIATAIVTDSNELTERRQVATPRDDISQLPALLETLIAPWRHQVDFIAVASTGIINDGCLTALNPANLGGLANFPLQSCIQSIAELPCVLLNDGQAAAWAEYQTLQHECDNVFFVTVSTGVGGGIILNRKLLMGKQGIAGHIGHTLSDPHGPQCGCGRTGCVESIASGTAIEFATRMWEQPVSAAQVFAMAKEGSVPAEHIIRQSAKAIAYMLADIHMVLDMERVIIGGSVGLAEGYLQRVAVEQMTLPEVYRIPILKAHHRQDSGLLGAALWAKTSL